MNVPSGAAARAVEFMLRCRCSGQPKPSTTITTPKPSRIQARTVSSSHLAPSNFSKQTRRRDTEIQIPSRFGSASPSSSSTSSTAQPIHNLPILLEQQQRNRALFNTSKDDTTTTSTTSTITTTTNTSSSSHNNTASTNLNLPVPGGFFNFLKYRVLNLPLPQPPPSPPPPFNVLNNPYRAKKLWPPNFDAMHPKQQFHFEKTFRRRMLLKTNSKRYNWNRYVRLVQQSLIVVTFVYFIFIADPYAKDGGGTPVDGFRAWFFGQVGKLEHLPGGLRGQAEELEAYYKRNWKKAPWNEGQKGVEDAEDAQQQQQQH